METSRGNPVSPNEIIEHSLIFTKISNYSAKYFFDGSKMKKLTEQES